MQKIEKGINLISLDKIKAAAFDTKAKDVVKTITLMRVDAKPFNVILVNIIHQCIQRIILLDQVRFLPKFMVDLAFKSVIASEYIERQRK